MSLRNLSETTERISRYVLEIKDIVENRNDAELIVFEAYPGFGKTLLGVHLSKHLGNSLYVTRTLKEMQTIINYGLDLGIKFRPIIGRMKFCHKIESDIPVELFSRLCHAYKRLGLCNEVVNRDLIIDLAKRSTDVYNLLEYVKSRNGSNICLYKAHLVLALKSRYVVTTYEFLLHHLDELSSLRKSISIYDECHTVMDMIESLTEEISPQTLTFLANTIKNRFPRLYYAIKSAIKRSSSARDLLDYLRNIGESDIEGSEIIKSIVDRCERDICAYDDELKTIKIIPDPFFIARNSFSDHKLLMSAYVPPLFTESKDVVFMRIEDGLPRVDTIIDTSITTKFKERTPDLIDRLVDVLQNYIDLSVAVLVVTPSKAIADGVARTLLRKGYRIAPPQAIDRVGPGTIVVDVAGGISTEGITPSRYVKQVIVLGMPFPTPTPILNALSKKYGFEKIYVYIALLRTLQAIGRLTRWGGKAVLVDRRFKDWIHRMPSWIEITAVH